LSWEETDAVPHVRRGFLDTGYRLRSAKRRYQAKIELRSFEAGSRRSRLTVDTNSRNPLQIGFLVACGGNNQHAPLLRVAGSRLQLLKADALLLFRVVVLKRWGSANRLGLAPRTLAHGGSYRCRPAHRGCGSQGRLAWRREGCGEGQCGGKQSRSIHGFLPLSNRWLREWRSRQA
jgi:hypothetical protein